MAHHHPGPDTSPITEPTAPARWFEPEPPCVLANDGAPAHHWCARSSNSHYDTDECRHCGTIRIIETLHDLISYVPPSGD